MFKNKQFSLNSKFIKNSINIITNQKIKLDLFIFYINCIFFTLI
jgi:hypothetical protein